MKKIASILAAVTVSVAFSNAQYTDLVSLGSSGVTVDNDGSTSGIFSQSLNSISFNTALVDGNAVQLNLVNTAVNWSAFDPATDFAVNMSFTGGGTAPSLGFNLQVWNSDFSNNIYFEGNTASATSVASYVPLTFASGDAAVLANPNTIIISWNDSGTPNVTMNSFAAVPEPSTYALMALGGLVLFFIARRRKAQQA